MRVKILEGMLLSKVVISTPKGFEGIDISHNENALCYESLEDLIQCLENCYNRHDFKENLGKNARNYIINKFDYNRIAHRLQETYKSILE